MSIPYTNKLRNRLFTPLNVVYITVIIALLFFVSSITREGAITTAIASAESTVRQYKMIRGYYTNNVIKKVLAGSELKGHFNHKDDPEKIPLPATFIHDISTQLTQQGIISLKLYSPFPFPNRKNRNLDSFGKEAWEALKKSPKQTFSKADQVNGKQVVRVALADTMSQAGCVACHNSHPDTPKNNWVLGEVRGILEVQIPIDEQIMAAKKLNFMIAGMVLVALAATVTFLFILFRQVISKLKEEKQKLVERTLELDREKQFIHSVMDSQNNIVITLENLEIKLANRAFFDFFGVQDLKEFRNTIADSISDLFSDSSPDCMQANMFDISWVEYIDQRQGELHKAIIEIDGLPYIFSISAEKFKFLNEELHTVVFTDISELERIRNKIELATKNTRDSIRYASLIQNSIVPSRNDYQFFFDDSFIYWKPRDIVGGDIYIFDILTSNQECLSMVIDCTGHGVPGAFVTMLVKAIERKIVANLSPTEEISVANIFSEFNKELKNILKQEKDSNVLSNVGFDGAILYYNKTKQIIKYSGSNTPLFYVKDGELNLIKGDKQSIGYKSSDINYQFNEHTLKTEKGMIFYITSDGYLDQNGGEKLFPFGKKKFKSIIERNHNKPLSEQKQIFMNELNIYKGNEEQTDDITLLALKI